jgi:hypothetical protein
VAYAPVRKSVVEQGAGLNKIRPPRNYIFHWIQFCYLQLRAVQLSGLGWRSGLGVIYYSCHAIIKFIFTQLAPVSRSPVQQAHLQLSEELGKKEISSPLAIISSFIICVVRSMQWLAELKWSGARGWRCLSSPPAIIWLHNRSTRHATAFRSIQLQRIPSWSNARGEKLDFSPGIIFIHTA